MDSAVPLLRHLDQHPAMIHHYSAMSNEQWLSVRRSYSRSVGDELVELLPPPRQEEALVVLLEPANDGVQQAAGNLGELVARLDEGPHVAQLAGQIDPQRVH
jgi:hypothetical protein